MRARDIKGLEKFPEEEQEAICKQVESYLFKNDTLYVVLQFIRGFFPGIAILAFLEAYFRITAFRDHSLITGFILGIVSIGVWLWVENYKSTRAAEVLPVVLAEMDLPEKD